MSSLDEGANSSSTVLTSLTLYGLLLLCAFGLFEILRRHYELTYSPRKRNNTVQTDIIGRKFGFFEWILPSLVTSDEIVFEQCGLDSLCFLRFLRMGTKLSAVGILISIVLFPIYAYSPPPEGLMERTLDVLEKISISNVAQGDRRIWISVIAMYVVSVYAMYLLFTEYKIYTRFRHHFLSQLGAQQYTILIKDLPLSLRSRTTLKEYMDNLFPGQVHSVHIAVDCGNLQKVVEQRYKVRNSLERAIALYESTRKRPMHRPIGVKTVTGNPIDSIQFYEVRLQQLNAQIYRDIELLTRSIEHGHGHGQLTPTSADHGYATLPARVIKDGIELISSLPFGSCSPSSAFVCFRSLKSAQAAQQIMQSEDPIVMNIDPAPHSGEIIWENLGTTWYQRKSWGLISALVTGAIVLFWTFPTAFVISLATVDKISKYIPGMAQVFKDIPALAEFVKQLAPLGLILMNMVAFSIFSALSRKEGHSSKSQVNAATFSKLVFFQIFQLFFVSVLAGTLIESISSVLNVLNEPSSIVTLLGTTIPAQSTTFITYLLAQAGLKLGVELLRIVPIIMGCVFRWGKPNSTWREKQSQEWLKIFRPTSEPGPFDQTEKLANYYLAVLLIFAFCVVAPLVTYVAGAFLLLSEIVYRRQLLFVYDSSTYSMGVFWPKLHNCIVGALILAQLTVIGIVSLKLAPGPLGTAIFLPILTSIYYFYVNSLWPCTAKNLPLNLCIQRDVERLQTGYRDFENIFQHVYVHPALTEGRPLAPENGAGDIDPDGGLKRLVEPKRVGYGAMSDSNYEARRMSP